MIPSFLYNPEIYKSSNYLVIDLETTNKDKGDAGNAENYIVATVVKYQGHTHRIRSSSIPDYIISMCEEADFIVAHNAKFEMKWLKRNGLDLTKVLAWDTMLAEYVRYGNKAPALDLDSTAQRYNVGGKLNFISYLLKKGVCPSEMPFSILGRYCEQDVHITEQIFLNQREYIYANDLHKVLHTRNITTPFLADVEGNGMFIDEDRVRPIIEKKTKEFNDLESRIIHMMGGGNPGSTKQLAEFVYETLGFDVPKDYKGDEIRTPKGALSTSADALKELKPKNKKQKEFLELYIEYNNINQLFSKTLNKLAAMLEAGENILYADFNQAVTQTHRLSSTGKKYRIQFQNFPRELKPIFKARNYGWKIGEADQAQLEFRVAAFLGNDIRAIDDIINDFDVHKFSASELHNCSMDEVTKGMRQTAKADTFKPLYGGTSGTTGQKRYYKAFRKRYSDITDTQNRWIQEVLHTKQLVLPTGFKFYWPDTKMKASGYITNTQNICNYPVQHFATADIVPIAVVHQWHRMKAANMSSFIINTIHDSSISEVQPEEEEQYEEIARLAYTDDVYTYLDVVYGIEFNVPLEAEVETDRNWADNPTFIEKWLT